MLLSNCFGWTSVETLKLFVSVQKRNNRNKRFVSDSAETSFGSSVGCFESKLVLKDTLVGGVAPLGFLLLAVQDWFSLSSILFLCSSSGCICHLRKKQQNQLFRSSIVHCTIFSQIDAKIFAIFVIKRIITGNFEIPHYQLIHILQIENYETVVPLLYKTSLNIVFAFHRHMCVARFHSISNRGL